MAILKVNPTRVSLLRLKKEHKVAKKGHKLLKDKRDGLVKKFMAVIYETRDLRASVEERLGSAFDSYTRATSMTSAAALNTALMVPNAKIDLDVAIKSVMSVKIPEFKVEKSGSAFSYGMLETTGDLDNAMVLIPKLAPPNVPARSVDTKARVPSGEIKTSGWPMPRSAVATAALRLPEASTAIQRTR